MEIIDSNFDSNIRPLSFGPLIQKTYVHRTAKHFSVVY